MRSACLVRTRFIFNNFLWDCMGGVPGPPPPLATPLLWCCHVCCNWMWLRIITPSTIFARSSTLWGCDLFCSHCWKNTCLAHSFQVSLQWRYCVGLCGGLWWQESQDEAFYIQLQISCRNSGIGYISAVGGVYVEKKLVTLVVLRSFTYEARINQLLGEAGTSIFCVILLGRCDVIFCYKSKFFTECIRCLLSCCVRSQEERSF